MKFLLCLIQISLAFGIPSCCPSGSSLNGNYCDCSSSYLVDSKVCVNSCPSLFVAYSGIPSSSGNTCVAPSGNDAVLFELKFTSIQDLTATYIANSANSNEKFLNPGSISFNSPTQNSPLPTIDRGFYFATTSSMMSDQNYTPALYFTLNLWIKPLSSGEILNVFSSSTQYIRIWADSSGVFKFSGIVYDTSNNVISISGASTSSYTSSWHKASIVLSQNSCTDSTLSFYINGLGAGSSTINSSEARFVGGVPYIWTLGNNSPSNSFRGFIYWLQARADITTSSFPLMASTINCVDNQYWDGSICQTCSGCSTWPWCIRGSSCSYCYTLGCSSCNGYSVTMCTSCNSGYFLYNNNICLSNCPTGYAENSSTKTCDFTSNTGLSINFYDKIVLDSISGISVGSSNVLAYPNYDPNDPYPAYLRGYYFTGATYLSTQVVTGLYFTISTWIYPTAAGTIFSKTVSGNEILCLEILSSGNPKLSLILNDSSAFSISLSANALNSWNFIAFTGKIDTNYKYTINSYLNSQTKDSGSSTNLAYFQDSSSGSFYIGTKSSLSNGFTGFLYNIIIYNVDNLQLSDYSISSCASPCSSCPSDHTCPDSCPLSQFNNGSSCVNCKASCTKGCRFLDSCRICKTKQCNSCTSFSGSCINCIINAESDGSGGCKCKANAFWSPGLERCEFCDVLCAVCKQTTYFECTSCISGKQLVEVLCLNDCPFGYGPSCSQVSTVVIDLCFYTNFQGGYGAFTTGADSSKYQPFVSPETVDPIPTYLRGLYFDSNMYLLSSQFIYISHSFTIGVWIYVITNGDLLQKLTRLKLSSTGAITAIMDDTLQVASTQTLSPTSSFIGWTYLSIVIYYISNSSGITIYINGVSSGSINVSERIYRDDKSTKLQLGKSDTSGFIGFIFYFQLWNVAITDFTTIINGFSFCGSGNKAICLWSCDIATYKSGSSYAACNSCAKGCRRAISCNICDDPLCAVCTGFESGKCTTCVSNASKNPTNCACNPGYGVSDDGFSCVSCLAVCQICTGGWYYQCTSCQAGNYLLNGICLAECPSGYTPNSSTKICDLSFTTYSISLSNIILLDTISGVNVGLSNTNSYPNYDINDPYPSYLRGYYYNYNSYLKTSFMFSPSFSISLWIRPSSAGFIISKYISTTAILQVKILSSYPQISLLLSDSLTTISVTGASSVLAGGWFYISFDCKINSDGTTTLKSYIDGASQATYTTSTRLYLLDSQSGDLYIGHYNSGFTGFLWNVNIYSQNNNALSAIGLFIEKLLIASIL